jgi:uncharacterized coiled-coil protein SlyX
MRRLKICLLIAPALVVASLLANYYDPSPIATHPQNLRAAQVLVLERLDSIEIQLQAQQRGHLARIEQKLDILVARLAESQRRNQAYAEASP